MFEDLLTELRKALEDVQESGFVEDFYKVLDITSSIKYKAEECILEYEDSTSQEE